MNDMISVIVPCYNIGSLVERSVRSIMRQSYPKLEIILVNDGSKDDTPEVLCRLMKDDARIKVINQENGGVTSARLTGVRAAAGEWIGFVDGDDEIESNMYEVLLGQALKHHADISHCGYQMVFPSRIDFYYNTGRLAQQDRKTGLQDLLNGDYVEPGLWNKLYRRALFDRLLQEHIIDQSIKINEDLLMNFYLFREAKHSVFLDKCFYHYMVRCGSAATAQVNENKLRDPLLVLKTILAEVNDDPELCRIVIGRIAQQLVALATLSARSRPELIKPYRTNARMELRKMLPQLLRGDNSKRIKMLSIWAAAWPASFRWAHWLYSHLRGTDKKYEVS